MIPTTLQGSSSTAPQVLNQEGADARVSLLRSSSQAPSSEAVGGQQNSNTTGPSSSFETESSFLKLVKDHHLLNPNIKFINSEKAVLKDMMSLVNSKFKPFEEKRLKHLQNGGHDNNTSQFFTAQDSAKYLEYSNKLRNLNATYDGLTNIFEDLNGIRNLANQLESTQKEITTVLEPQLSETRNNLQLLSITKNKLEKQKTFNNLDPKNHFFTKEDSQKLISTELEISKLKSIEYDLEIKLEGRDTFMATFTRELKKDRIYPVVRESQIVSEAILDNNPV